MAGSVEDGELADILQGGGPPSVIIRKESTADDNNEDDRQQQAMTPAPMASFEALTDVEDSDGGNGGEQNGSDSAEALRELATTLDIPVGASSSNRQKSVAQSKQAASGSGNGNDISGSDMNSSSVPLPPPPSPMTTGFDDDRSQDFVEDTENVAEAADPFTVISDIASGSRSSNAAPDVTSGGDQNTWSLTQDGNEEQSWITFEEEESEDEEDDDEDDEEARQDEGNAAEAGEDADVAKQPPPSRPPQPTAKPQRPPPPPGGDVNISSNVVESDADLKLRLQQALATAGAELEGVDPKLIYHEKKKKKIKVPSSAKKLIKNITKKEKKESSDKATKDKADLEASENAGSALADQPKPQKVKKEFVMPENDSEEWKKFKEMQDRISQVLAKTSEKVVQMEHGFETELNKLEAESQRIQSPWIIIGPDGEVNPVVPVKTPEKDSAASVVKSNSWVGFDDTFDAEAAVADEDEVTTDDVAPADTAAAAGFEETTVVSPTVEKAATETVVESQPHTSAAAAAVDEEEANSPIQSKPEMEPEPEMQSEPAANDESSAARIESPTETAVTASAVEVEEEELDPFDVANLVTAMTTGKSLAKAIDETEEKVQMAKKLKQLEADKVAADRKLTEATGGRARPRPRAQGSLKSANPFKLSLAVRDVGSVDDGEQGDEYEYQPSPYKYGAAAAEVPLSSANPFANLPSAEIPASDNDHDEWNLFGETKGGGLELVAAEDESGYDFWSKTSPLVAATDNFTFEATFADLLSSADKQGKKDKDTGSIRSSKSSLDEQAEELEPLEPFCPKWDGISGWSMYLRSPLKKKLTQNRSWRQVFVRITMPAAAGDCPRLKVYESEAPTAVCLHEIAMVPTCQLRRMELQQFDNFSKCHTVKVEHLAYVEKLALKGDRIAPTLRDVTKVRSVKGLKDLMHKPKTTMVFSHSASPTDSFKFCTLDYVSYKHFIRAFEDVQFAQKDALSRVRVPNSYTKDEVIIDMIDEYYADIDCSGHINFHKARVRMLCLSFLSGRPIIEIGINDRKRRGNEIVGRADIIPIKTEDWIRYEDIELSGIVDPEEYEKTRLIKFPPPDAARFEVMRFRVRPRINVELPLQISIQMSSTDPRQVEIRADLMIPGYYSTSRRASQVACEDIQIRFPVPEALAYLFRVEKRFKYGSIHSAKKKPGRIKGFERLAGLASQAVSGVITGGSSSSSNATGTTPLVLEASTGLAKYEHVYRAVVWRISRLPERNQGAYKTHLFHMKFELGPHDTPPTEYSRFVYVEYKMADCTASRAQVRSVSLSGQSYEEPPDRWVRHQAKYEYSVEVELTDQVKAPTHTDVPDIAEFMAPPPAAILGAGGAVINTRDVGGSGFSSGASSAGDSTAEDSSDDSDDSD